MNSTSTHPAGSESARDTEPVAIVGLGGVFPHSIDLEQFWNLVENGIDVSRSAPPGRWILNPASIVNSQVGALDSVFHDRGCFIENFQINMDGLQVSAKLINELDLSFQFLLEAGRNAYRSARLDSVDPARIGVIVGNIALPTDAASHLCEQLLTPIIESRMKGGKASANSLKFSGLNRYAVGLPAGLLAQALGLGGGSFALDAACASSLFAIKHACDELRAGRADAMLAGGVSRPDSLYTQMGFSQLRALSSSGRCAPFDVSGSGLIVGEGAGIIALKRLSTAMHDKDVIYAVIRGAGLSTDLEGSLLSPHSEGQLRALRQAYQQAGWHPQQVDMIECHATGTPVGDAVEFESLMQLWQGGQWNPGQCILGAVKANVGHLLTAAGIAGVIKILLAFKHNVLPITANFQQAGPKIPLSGSPFEILKKSRPWERRHPGIPRRAAINGFGFGGANAHLLLEEFVHEPSIKYYPVPAIPSPNPVAIVGMAARVGPWADLSAFTERIFGGFSNTEPQAKDAWRGIPTADLCRIAGAEKVAFAGYYLDDIAIPPARYRIPPRELAELLPQQALMLEVARSAWQDGRLSRFESARTGVFIGLGLDFRTTDYHLRWSMLGSKAQQNSASGAISTDACGGPALTADRTLGALAGVSAARIAREFHFGGPCHTVSNEDCSGIRAFEIAVRALQQGEIDQAVAGAVDICSDMRALLAADAIRPFSRQGMSRPFDTHASGPIPGEGAVALVLKRLEDAQRDGDRIYAVVRGVGAASGGEAGRTDEQAYANALKRAYAEASIDPLSVRHIEANGSGSPPEDRIEAAVLGSFFCSAVQRITLGSAQSCFGHAGAASGMVSLAKACLALYHETIPPMGDIQTPLPELSGKFAFPGNPQYWARNRIEGPRRVGVSSLSLDGNCMHVVLESLEKQSSQRSVVERAAPVLRRAEALFACQAGELSGLIAQLEELSKFVEGQADKPVDVLARLWWKISNSPPAQDCLIAFVAHKAQQLQRLLNEAIDMVRQNRRQPTSPEGRDRIFYAPLPDRLRGELAFVFPGSGNHFVDMGRELALWWPAILRTQDLQNDCLASQMHVQQFWNGSMKDGLAKDHRALICGQVALGSFTADLALSMGLKPSSAIGYSLGESAALFALRAWSQRDEMFRRVSQSSLFRHDLAGTPERMQELWQLPQGTEATWQTGLVGCSADAVRSILSDFQRIYILIINTPNECVLGGDAKELQRLTARLQCPWIPLEGISTVHCELLNPVERAYRDLHLFETKAPAGVRFYSGGWGKTYEPTQETAADAIVAQAKGCIDFSRVVRAAYDSGVRLFLEMGPGSSCSRMISQILSDQPHWAKSLCVAGQEPLFNVLRIFGQLYAEGVPISFQSLYETEARTEVVETHERARSVRIPAAGPAFELPQQLIVPQKAVHRGVIGAESAIVLDAITAVQPVASSEWDPFEAEMFHAMAQTQEATLKAHRTFLDFSQKNISGIADHIRWQLAIIGQAGNPAAIRSLPMASFAHSLSSNLDSRKPPFMDRAACLEFARGSVTSVLGPEFSEADTFPTRVRLPDEPLMLVDRIIEVEGAPRSMTRGRVVTEHDICSGAWYLDGGKIPTCIAVEAGQADLFLSGYLGIDFQTRGRAVYRLLDARVCFHQSLPGPGSVIHYDIHIERFFRQSDTWLFRFHFEATVDGQPFLTMTHGCAGFFSKEELARGRGIVRTSIDLKPMAGKRPADWENLVPMAVESYSAVQLDALRMGDIHGCFGPQFAQLPVRRPITLPSGMMKLVHRVPHLDPKGGRFGLGLIRGEADIHPSDWFLTCHFVDDRVMPGTLMYECCMHTLRIYLLRLGWIVEQDTAVLEPVPEIISQLKCRGQVLETTQVAMYEVSIKEIGCRPEPYVIANALMYADGKPIVEITNMSLRYAGIRLETITQVWARGNAAKKILYDRSRILAFAIGKPSEAFGPPYKVFDEERRIARLPGPPYQFLDCITEVQGEAFKLVEGGLAEAEYKVPADAWYFAENRQDLMPFAILLEIALQPCGWLAAYVGSALASEEDLSFRNLGGSAVQSQRIGPDTGTLTIRVKLTRMSISAGMIIQWFDFEVRAGASLIYQGDTYFGFFPKAALLRQEGLQNAKLHTLGAGELQQARSLPYPKNPPFAGDMLRMVDHIEHYLPNGGLHRLGFMRATRKVDPDEWFFKAHFYQDPVVPGSLGLESFLQMMKYMAIQRWGHQEGACWQSVALNQKHEWTYRGQVIPSNKLVTVEAVVVEVDDARRLMSADGYLSVDGRIIYGMKHFTIQQLDFADTP